SSAVARIASNSACTNSTEISNPSDGFAMNHHARSSGESRASTGADHSNQHNDPGSSDRARLRTARRCTLDRIPALEVYQSCGFPRIDRAAIVGKIATIVSGVNANASSRITRSPVKPRPDVLLRARNFTRAPDLSTISVASFDW